MCWSSKKIDKDDNKTPQAAMQSALQQLHDYADAGDAAYTSVPQFSGIGVVVDGKQG